MHADEYPVLEGKRLFRPGESVYIHISNDFTEYDGVFHKHDFIELVYVISGEGIHRVGDEFYETSKGDLFIINYDVPHIFYKKPGSSQLPVTYDCLFHPDFIDSGLIGSNNFSDVMNSFLFRSLELEKQSPAPDIHLFGTDFSGFGDIFTRMYYEYRDMKKGYSDIIRGYLIELIIKIFRKLNEKENGSPSAKNVEIVRRAIEYLSQRYNTDVTLEEAARNSFLSKNYFSKLFKDVTGRKFCDYVNELRVEEACQLLKGTDRVIADIAFEAGFNDLKLFYSVFRKITGKTPGAFRRS